MYKSPPISEYLQRGNNSFSLLRLFAAVAVVISHAWTTVGGDDVYEPLQSTTGFTLGWHAVNLFFALSGLLIIGSLENDRSLLKFAWARVLRIYPAMLVVISLTVIIAGMATNTTQWQTNHVAEYLIRNFMLVGSSATLPGVFSDIPSPHIINTPLWTLKYEVLAYMSAAGLVALSWRHAKIIQMKYASLGILSACGVALISVGPGIEYGPYEHAVRLFFAFYLGVAGWYWRDRIFVRYETLLALMVVAAVQIHYDVYYAPVLIALIAYSALFLGTFDFGAAKRFADRQDYSYAIYIIGFPVQQTVMATTGIANPWFNFLMTLIIVLPLAVLSWNLVEKPVLRLKNFDKLDSIQRLRTFIFQNSHLFSPTPAYRKASPR